MHIRTFLFLPGFVEGSSKWIFSTLINVECLQYEYLESLDETAFALFRGVIQKDSPQSITELLYRIYIVREEIFSRGHSRSD